MDNGVDMVMAPPRTDRATTRLVGIDAARALAFGGMLLAHFAVSLRPGDPGWLQAVDKAADGRAAAAKTASKSVHAAPLTRNGNDKPKSAKNKSKAIRP